MSSALSGAEDQLERVLTQRATLGRQLGDVTAVGQERDGLTAALHTLERQHSHLRNDLAEREVERRPAWARDILGERPDRPADAERWDRAAFPIARYCIDYEIPDADATLGPEPVGREQRRACDRVELARQELARELGRVTREHDLGLG